MDFLEQAKLGDELKRAAHMKEISLATLSRLTGVPYSRLLRLLLGHRKPRPYELERIAELVDHPHGSEAK